MSCARKLIECCDCGQTIECRGSRHTRCGGCARSKRLKTSSQWQLANPDNARIATKNWRENNQDVVRSTYAAWYAQNRGRRRTGRNRWRGANPEKVRAQAGRRRGLKRGAEGSFTATDFVVLLARYNHTCPRCGATEDLTADHIVPLKHGGNNWPWNITVLCGSCNSMKRDRWISEFEPWDGVSARPIILIRLWIGRTCARPKP